MLPVISHWLRKIIITNSSALPLPHLPHSLDQKCVALRVRYMVFKHFRTQVYFINQCNTCHYKFWFKTQNRLNESSYILIIMCQGLLTYEESELFLFAICSCNHNFSSVFPQLKEAYNEHVRGNNLITCF